MNMISLAAMWSAGWSNQRSLAEQALASSASGQFAADSWALRTNTKLQQFTQMSWHMIIYAALDLPRIVGSEADERL